MLVGGPAATCCAATEHERPNIVLIVADDVGYADLSVHGSREIPTPHIDALAAAGVRCTDGCVSGPYCSPCRAGLLTGRYQTRFGHEFNPHGRHGLPLSESTIADRMQEAGYVTGLVGKWHLGHLPRFHPLRRGFDEFFCFLGGGHSYIPGAGAQVLRNTMPVDETGYLTEAFGREANDFIERHRKQPFFLYLAFNAAHTPMQATESKLKQFESILNPQRRAYAAMISSMDDAIGAVLDKLRDARLEENTLVVFISDNGGPTMRGTAENASNNAPLRGSKCTTLEGGIRVPFIVKWPARLPAHTVYRRPVIQLDILPTALAAAGVAVEPDWKLEGVDLVPFLKGEREDYPHESLCWRLSKQMAIRQGDWKLVRYDPAIDGNEGAVTEAKLYNLADDIGEQHDLYDEEPARAAALQSAWDEWNASNVPPRWPPPPIEIRSGAIKL